MQPVQQQPSTGRFTLSAIKMQKLGVRINNKFYLSLECLECGEIWAPQLRPEGTLPRGYWKCPNRCNW